MNPHEGKGVAQIAPGTPFFEIKDDGVPVAYLIIALAHNINERLPEATSSRTPNSGIEGRLLRDGCKDAMRYIQNKGLLIVIAFEKRGS